jgi:glucose/mannose transport system permease protein
MQRVEARTVPASVAASRWRWLSGDRLTAFLMILPSLVAIAVFVYGFIAWTGYVSLSAWTSLKVDYSFVGFDNYVAVFKEPRFWANARNLIVFTTFFLVSCLVLGLALALMVDARIRAEGFFRSVYIFPMALSFIVTGVAWRWIFTPGDAEPTGLNLIFHNFGLDFLRGDWISDRRVLPGWYPSWSLTRLGLPMAIVPVIVAAVWQMSGFTMAMYLAGLRAIPEDVKEAARVDGCSEWQLFRNVTFPLLRPVTLSAVIILGHISLKIFDLVVTMTGGGPGNLTEVPGLLMYALTFSQNNIAQGAAVAMMMLLLISVLIVPYLIYNRRTEVEG